MTAKELFEKYDYELIDVRYFKTPSGDERRTIIYQQDDGGRMIELTFNGTFKRLEITEYETYNENKPQGYTTYYPEVITAINLQMKELGWIE